MNYYAIKIKYSSPVADEVVADVLAAELGEIGFESFTTEEGVLTGYIQEKIYHQEQVQACLEQFPLTEVSFETTSELIVGQDWNEEWEKNYFKPIRIGKECLIRASFHPEEEGFTYPILIDPKMAFGTGNHETTFLMISEILQLDLQGKEVLDMGCGTAVLAILAAMKQARRIVAIDIDEWAYANAIENIQLNGVENIKVALGGAEQIEAYAPFDVILANINRNILLADIPVYARHLQTGGHLFLSGFYTEDIPAIRQACENQGLTWESTTQKNNWVALKIKK